ncbi:hypothetical protein JEQ12_015393, partial [Ovis aries]
MSRPRCSELLLLPEPLPLRLRAAGARSSVASWAVKKSIPARSKDNLKIFKTKLSMFSFKLAPFTIFFIL